MRDDGGAGHAPAAAPVRGLVLRAAGPVPAAFVRDVAARVSRSVALPCRTGPPLAVADVPHVAGRDQWDADALLALVETGAAEPGAVVVALAARDMGSAVFTHFFGRARLSGGALVVSVARLTPAFYGLPDDPATTLRRTAAEVLHELGHVAGLVHCAQPRCLMRLARNVEAIDVRGATFCATCSAAVPGHFLRG